METIIGPLGEVDNMAQLFFHRAVTPPVILHFISVFHIFMD
jgi:hypothetical protein